MSLSRSPEDLCSRIRDLIAIVARLQVILTALEQEELTFRGQSDIEEFVSLFQERNNHTPKHINRGYTPRGVPPYISPSKSRKRRAASIDS